MRSACKSESSIRKGKLLALRKPRRKVRVKEEEVIDGDLLFNATSVNPAVLQIVEGNSSAFRERNLITFQSCRFCLDKPKFGGPGRLKQKCIERRCILEKQSDDQHSPRTSSTMISSINVSKTDVSKKQPEYVLAYTQPEQKPTTAKIEIKAPGGFMPLFKPVTVTPPVVIDRSANNGSTVAHSIHPQHQPAVVLPKRELTVEQTPPVKREEIIQDQGTIAVSEGEHLTDEDEEIQVDA